MAASDTHYGPRRLGALYEISKLLTLFVKTAEATVQMLLAAITKEFPLQSVVLIETTSELPKVTVWHSPDISPADLQASQERALASFVKLTGAARPSADEIAANTTIATPLPAVQKEVNLPAQGRFLTSPLIIHGQTVFGVLHLEGVAPFRERDIDFVSAIANQIAIALERTRARLHEIELRKQAEASRKSAEIEMAGRKHVEEEVRRLNADLERRVAERTSQFKETIGELNAFTYSIAHDLRAPLRHIYGYSKMLLSSSDEQTWKGYAQSILAASQGMDALIKDLLAYSRLTLEEIKIQPVSLSALLARIKADIQPDLEERAAELKIEEPLPDVLGNETALRQAITNLLDNGLKFAAPGATPRVLVRAEERGGWVRLWVEDNGIGIAPEHQERIFGVFERLHRSEDFPGTGIGLAIVRRTMERMKGRVGVDSRLGMGSRFWIELKTAPGPA